MAHEIVWFEVMGKDAKRSRDFYGTLFGWGFGPAEGPLDYAVVGDTGRVPGGIGGGLPSTWNTFYVGVEDLDAALAQAEALGAKVLLPRQDMPDISIAVIADPDGLPVGLAARPAA